MGIEIRQTRWRFQTTCLQTRRSPRLTPLFCEALGQCRPFVRSEGRLRLLQTCTQTRGGEIEQGTQLQRQATLDLDTPVEVATDDSLRTGRSYRRRRGIVGA